MSTVHFLDHASGTIKPGAPATSQALPDLKTAPELEIGEVLGEGGMGVVRLATQGRLGREVAVKQLKPGAPKHAADALLREAWVTGALEHPNIVPVHDVMVDASGNPTIVLKRIEGTSWQDFFDDVELIPAEARADPIAWHLRILVTVCNAVEFAHQRSILHRDLKPANVMVGSFGEVYLLDWGISVALRPDVAGRFPVVGRNNRVAGTPLFMAPEMYQRGLDGLGRGTDVYLLAGILYYVLAGRPPRRRSEVKAMAKASLTPPVLGESWPSELRELMAQCFAEDVLSRPDAGAFSAALRLHLARRDAGKLLGSALVRFEQLQAVIESTAAGHENDTHLQVHDHYGACRFGLKEVLNRWPGNLEARDTLRAVFLTMVRYELGRQDPRAASVILGQVSDPPEDLVERVDSLTRDAERARARLARLDEDLDGATGFRARVVVLAILVAVWILMPTLLSFAGFGRSYARIGVMSITTLAVTGLGGLLFRQDIFRSRMNRTFFVVALLSPILGSLLAISFWVWEFDIYRETTLRAYLDGTLILLAALLVDRRILPSAFAFFSVFLFGIFQPTWSGVATNVATAFLLCNGLVAWMAIGRDRTDPPVPMI